MNIFVLDKNPGIAAQYHCDKHVIKMIVESAQLLSTALHYHGYGNDKIYKSTHINHPCSKWVRESWYNFDWLLDLLMFLLDEYKFRYGKRHKTTDVFYEINHIRKYLKFPITLYPYNYITSFALAMPDEFKTNDDPVESYRKYYKIAKKDICKWTKREIPDWWNNV